MPHRAKQRSICVIQSLLKNKLTQRTQFSQAISSLELLSSKGIRLPSKTLASLIKHCANTKSLKEGKWVHLHLKLTGLKRPSTFLSNRLINMYLECGNEFLARKVFDEMPYRNVYSWNNMLSGYVKLGMMKQARSLFEKMQDRDVVSWNTMIIGYAQAGWFEKSLRLYKEFKRLGIGYNEYSFSGVLIICVKMEELGLTRQVHGQVLVGGLMSSLVILNSVLDAYAKCGEMSDARRLFGDMKLRDIFSWTTLVSGYARWGDMNSAREQFDRMPTKNPVSWTALIAGYVRNGMGHASLKLFSKMIAFHVRPQQYTFSSCLCACASIASFKHGKQIHGYMIRTYFRPNIIVLSSLIDMYSKCGRLDVARRLFHLTCDKQDSILWNTIISALAQHAHGEEAIQVFDDMLRSGVKPNRITLVIILKACIHSGLLQAGLRYFKSMTCDHGIEPDQEHYACLINLIGQAGCFDELLNQLEKVPYHPNEQVWNALLDVCRSHGNVDSGRQVAEKLIELEPKSPAAYVLLSRAYAELGRWELVEKVEQLMNERNVKQDLAIS